MKKKEVVAAAIFDPAKGLLCAQRAKDDSLPLKWEFPGGKIKPGETHEEALRREILEELSVAVDVKGHLMSIEHDYPEFHLTLHVYEVQIIEGTVRNNVHQRVEWIAITQLGNLDWAPANHPLVQRIVSGEITPR